MLARAPNQPDECGCAADLVQRDCGRPAVTGGGQDPQLIRQLGRQWLGVLGGQKSCTHVDAMRCHLALHGIGTLHALRF